VSNYLCKSFDKIPLFNYFLVLESNSEQGQHVLHSQTIYTLASTCQLTCLQQWVVTITHVMDAIMTNYTCSACKADVNTYPSIRLLLGLHSW